MDVTLKHPMYEQRLSQWVRQRDAMEGEDRVKEKGDLYLPRLDGQAGPDTFVGTAEAVKVTSYEAYKSRASFMNALSRTTEALSGAVMRKSPDIEWPKSALDFLKTVGRCGESFGEVTQEVLDEVIGIGRFGHLVDQEAPVAGQTVGDPYVATYFAENICNWYDEVIKGRRTTTMVVLLETTTAPDGDGGYAEKQRYRVLWLGVPSPQTDEEKQLSLDAFLALWGLNVSDFTEGPVYFQEVWDEVETAKADKKVFVRTAVIVPHMSGGALWREIPWTFFNPGSTKAKPDKPPLMDQTVINFSLYRNSADLEHGLHFTALPQAWASGFKFKGELFVGSSVAWVSEETGAQCGYLEFQGAGLGAIREQMEAKKKEMAALGARTLEEQSPAGSAEAAQTVMLRQSGEKSVLARISINVSEGLTRTLRFLALFKGIGNPDKVGITLNTDFGVGRLSPQELVALMQQVQAGFMSWNTYFFNLKRGDLIPEEVTEEDETKRIEAGSPQDPNSVLNPQPGTSGDAQAPGDQGQPPPNDQAKK